MQSLTFLGETASPTALGTSDPPFSDGIVFDPRPFDGVAPFRTDGFPFTIGATSGGLTPQRVRPSYSVTGRGESAPGQYSHLTLTFRGGLKPGEGLRFGVDRDLAVSGFGGANEGSGADELGGAIFLPQGVSSTQGMEFVATLANGRTVRGTMRNKVGFGFSPVDGFGVINAEQAVGGR